MSTRFTTELVEEQPQVVVVGEPSSLLGGVVQLLEKRGVQAQIIDPSTVDANAFHQVFSKAYKTVWVPGSNPGEYAYEAAVSFFNQLDLPITIVLPVLSFINPTPYSHQVLHEWYQQAKKRQEKILDCNHRLPGAGFVFLADLTETEPTNDSPLHFICRTIEDGYLVNPDVKWSLQSLESALEAGGEYILRGGRTGSVVIKPDAVNSIDTLSFVKYKFDVYHQFSLRINNSTTALQELIPFRTAKKKSSGLSPDELTEIVRRLPAPKVKNQAFGTNLETDLVPPATPTINQTRTHRRVVDYFPSPSPVAQAVVEDLSVPVQDLRQQDVLPNNKPLNAEPLKDAVKTESLQKEVPPELEKQPAVKPPKSTKPPEFDVSGELSKIFTTKRNKQKSGHIKQLIKTEKQYFKKSKRKTMLFWGGLVSVVLAGAIVVFSAVFLTSQLVVKKSLLGVIQEAQASETTDITTLSSWKNLRRSTKFLSFQTDIYQSLLDSELFANAAMLADLSGYLNQASESMSQVKTNAQAAVLFALGRGQGDISTLTKNLTSEAQTTYDNLSLVQAQLEQLGQIIQDDEAKTLFADYETKIREKRQALAAVQRLGPHLEGILGKEGKKTYAVVLQNNHELRPTGGFIQAVALLTFENGALLSRQVYSSYEIDRRFAGATNPPEEIRQYLGEENWYFRDSNWNPHFPSAAEKMAWFLEKSLGTKVDGVIGLNLFTLEDIIASVGPVDLDEYNETLTHRNLQERMEFHSEVILVENTSAKDYGVLVLGAVLDKMVNLSDEKIVGLLSVLSRAMETQQLSVAVFEPSAQETLASLGWSGSMVQPNCPPQLNDDTCIVDTVAQIEANVGVNKANYYVKRSINQVVTLNPQEISHQRSILLENTAQTNAWPKGSYKAYMRFYLPKEAAVQGVTVGNQAVQPESLRVWSENDRVVAGVLVDVPIGQAQQINIVYSEPADLFETFSYAFFNQKQAGTAETPLTVTIINNTGRYPALIAPQAEVNGNTIVFDKINEKHSFVGVRFD